MRKSFKKNIDGKKTIKAYKSNQNATQNFHITLLAII